MTRNYHVEDTKDAKILSGEKCHFFFNKRTGYFVSWGESPEQDCEGLPGPAILDMEVTTKCSGGCPFCYKSNSLEGENMPLETFKSLVDKLPSTVTQIALGADSDLSSNPDIFEMMRYVREKGIVPNITLASATEDVADELARLCGAVAVSRYEDPDKCYDTVFKLVSRGMKQVNIHLMLSKETLGVVYQTLTDLETDPRLIGVNALVFLSLKQKGRGEGYSPLSQEEFDEVVDSALLHPNFKLGFDSCSASKIYSYTNSRVYSPIGKNSIIPCEATLESGYINVKGEFFPCSFVEGTEDWERGIDILGCSDFIEEVWNNERVSSFRESLLNQTTPCRSCPKFKV